MVSGMPRPIPAGVLVTYRLKVTARGRGLMSSMGMARLWVQATAFSEMKRISPGCIRSLAYRTTTSDMSSASVIRWVFTGMRW